MQQRFLGATGLSVSRLGLGTMTWGRDTDEHEAREQLAAFVDAGGTLVDTAAGYTDGDSERLIGTLLGDVCARDDIVLATKAGIGRRKGERFTNASRGHLVSSPRRVPGAAGVDHVDLWQVHTWVDDAPIEETLERTRLRRDERPGVVRRGEQLQRLAVRTGGHLAARGPRSGRAGVQPGRVLPAQPRRRGRDASRRASARARRTPLVAAGSRRAHRQVPRRHPGRLARRLTALLTFVGRYLGDSSQRVVEAVARAADGLGWSSLEVALAWVRDRPGVTAPIIGARTAAQLRESLTRRGVRPPGRDHLGPRRRVRRPAGGRE